MGLSQSLCPTICGKPRVTRTVSPARRIIRVMRRLGVMARLLSSGAAASRAARRLTGRTAAG